MGRRVYLGNGWWSERLPSGKVKMRKEVSLRKSLAANSEMRKEVGRDLRPTVTESGSMRVIASMPKPVARHRDAVTGGDPEKDLMFLRDHPEFLCVPKRAADLPTRKMHSFPKHMRPRR